MDTISEGQEGAYKLRATHSDASLSIDFVAAEWQKAAVQPSNELLTS